MAIGWGLWLFGLVTAFLCQGLQSNAMLASPNNPCAGLWWAVLGGFVFLAITSVVALNYSSKHRRRH